MTPSNKLLSDLVTVRTYSKYLPELQRREIFEETINRCMTMHLDRFPKLSKEIVKAFSLVHQFKVMPSMRSLQFSGPAILKNNLRSFNCAFTPINEIRTFSEIFFLLLSGAGVGFSVQKAHINQLPRVTKPTQEGRFIIQDSIAGWAQALHMLMEAYFTGSVRPVFDFTSISPKGTLLNTTGAKAPGFAALKHMLELVESKLILALGRHLEPIEVHDLVCIVSDAVLAGGIRRSSLISFFDRDNKPMLLAKSGKWWENSPYRARANNSAVLPRHEVTKDEFLNIFKILQESNAGEPGFSFTNNINMLANPSLRAGTKVLTTNGIFEIQELEGKIFKVPNLNGEIKDAKCWKSGKNVPLWELTLDTGEKYYSSPEHKWPIFVNGRFIKCKSIELRPGDLLPVNVFSRETLFESGEKGTYNQGFLIGWLYGDGSLTIRSDTKKKVAFFIVSKKDGKNILDLLLSEIKKIDGKDRKIYERGKVWEFQIGSNEFIQFLEKMSVNVKSEGLPVGIFKDWTEAARRGFIDGIFSSDGYLQADPHDFISLGSSKIKLIKDIQDLLGFYGIKTMLDKKNIKNPTFPNGKQYNRQYEHWVMRTHNQGKKKFSKIFSLSVEFKNEKLQKNNDGIKQEFIKVKSIRLTNLREDVWDINVLDETHCFQLPQVTTGNCHEVALYPNQLCNLSTVNQTGVSSKKDFLSRVYSAAFIGTLQASYTDFPYVSDKWRIQTEKEALLGVSFTGIADADGLVTDDWISEAGQLVLDVNEKYAKKMGINLAARTTVIKPEGSASCTLGSSSGIHARKSPYYLRRVQINKDDALYLYLLSAVPDLMDDAFGVPNTSVVTIPQESPRGAPTEETETAIELFNRVLRYNKNWISSGHRSGDNKNNVSCTLSVKPEEWDKLGNLMWKERDNYTGISLFPFDNGTYQQAPFQAITKEEFEEWNKKVKELDLTKVKEFENNTNLVDSAACGGGACIITHL